MIRKIICINNFIIYQWFFIWQCLRQIIRLITFNEPMQIHVIFRDNGYKRMWYKTTMHHSHNMRKQIIIGQSTVFNIEHWLTQNSIRLICISFNFYNCYNKCVFVIQTFVLIWSGWFLKSGKLVFWFFVLNKTTRKRFANVINKAIYDTWL